MYKGFSSEPDPKVLTVLDRSERVALIAIAVVVSTIMGLWLIPFLRVLAPPHWSEMVFNTAVGIALSFCSLTLSTKRTSSRQLWLSQVAAIIVLVLGMLTLAEYATRTSFGIDTWLPHATVGLYPGRPSPQTSLGLALVGSSLLVIRQYKNRRSALADVFALSLVTLVLAVVGGYLFNAEEIVGLNSSTLMAPLTLLCLSCLSFIICARRARQGGALSVVVNLGIGSHFVRVALPFALVLPFAIFVTVAVLINTQRLAAPYARAFGAATASFLTLFVVVWMARRINRMERELQLLSLTDELTQLNNRRGFYVLAQQSFREAVRSDVGLMIFYFDLDGLKRTNDTLGHEAGSELIQAFATILLRTFRASDVVGRVGGDEFAVAAGGITARTTEPLARLENVVAEFNKVADAACPLRYSCGFAELTSGSSLTFEQLIAQADAMMYQQKMSKKNSGLYTRSTDHPMVAPAPKT